MKRTKRQKLWSEFQEVTEFCGRFIYVTRDNGLQEEAATRLRAFLSKALKAKKAAADQQDEDFANEILFFELVCRAFLDFVGMWLAIKNDQMVEAFECLVRAQREAGCALSIKDLEPTQVLSRRLSLLEDILFPPQQFVSSALVTRGTKCSICGSEYGTCGHIRGRAYMGRLCQCIVERITVVDHVALVDDPADKSCRLLADAYGRDWMTLRSEGTEQATTESVTCDTDDREQFLSLVAKSMSSCQTFFFITRGKEFQEQAASQLLHLIETILAEKRRAIEHQDEEWANALLVYETLANAYLEFISMWIKVKNDDMDSAWGHLVDAQDHFRSVLQMHHEDGVQRMAMWLQAIEKFAFPPQVFSSAGIIVHEHTCSICGQEYGTCGHIKGRVYMGEMCVRKISNYTVKETSLVDDPSSKHCRVTKVRLDGENRHWLTWRIVADEEGDDPNQLSMRFTCEDMSNDIVAPIAQMARINLRGSRPSCDAARS